MTRAARAETAEGSPTIAETVALLRRYIARELVTRAEYEHLSRRYQIFSPFTARIVLERFVGPPVVVRRAPEPPRVKKKDRPKCGAKCRDGHACVAPAFFDPARPKAGGGRCRMHGGLSRGRRAA